MGAATAAPGRLPAEAVPSVVEPISARSSRGEAGMAGKALKTAVFLASVTLFVVAFHRLAW